MWPGKPKPRTAGPWSDGKPRQELWVGRGAMHMVGPDGRTYRNANMSDGEAARQRYIDRISNAWRDHRK